MAMFTMPFFNSAEVDKNKVATTAQGALISALQAGKTNNYNVGYTTVGFSGDSVFVEWWFAENNIYRLSITLTGYASFIHFDGNAWTVVRQIS